MSATWSLRHARAVLPHGILDDATIVAERGVVVSITAGGAAPAGAVDARGAFVLPGLVDSHSDGLEKELAPRPGVRFPPAFALASFEGRVLAAGVTTMFHGVGFEEDDRKERTIEQALALTSAIAARRSDTVPLVDHRILYRLDARDPAGLEALQRRLPVDARAGVHGGVAPLVSFEDHTPGQGQYLDTTYFVRWLMSTRRIDEAEARALVEQRVAERSAHIDQRSIGAAWLSEQAHLGLVRLLAHDPVDAGEVADAYASGAAIAEFPTSVEAATAAIDAGLVTVMGAPNVLRGGSHAGNVSARELVARRLCTGLASDYLPSAMLAAAFRLAVDEVVPLPEAVGLVTSGPAKVVGLDDRGRLEVGQRADAVVVTLDGAWPTVRATFTAASSEAAHPHESSLERISA